MTIKLYLDEDVDPLLARVLLERGIDSLSTREANNQGRSDYEQLAFAADQGRVIKGDLTDKLFWLQDYKDPNL